LTVHFFSNIYFNLLFSLNSALISRCRVVVLNKLSTQSIRQILDRALLSKNVTVRKTSQSVVVSKRTVETSKENVSASTGVLIDEEAVDYLSTICDGDARTALNCLEIALSKQDADHDTKGADAPNNESTFSFSAILKGLLKST
jgi:putative ATPase